MGKRAAKPGLSWEGEKQVESYAVFLRDEQDLAPDAVRNYLSDIRQFAAFCESSWEEGEESGEPFSLEAVTTPTITQYCSHLRNTRELKPASINRHLVSIKRYFGRAIDEELIARDPTKAVKLVPPPRHLTDKEEAALVAAVERHGMVRDRTLIVLVLYTGLRTEELCGLKPSHVKMAKRSGSLQVWGKRGKYREVPLNSTAREVPTEWMAGLPENAPYLFPSRKKKGKGSANGKREHRPLTDRALGYVVAKYAALARVEDVSPHALRHRFGYEMAKRVPLHRLAKIMGHDSFDTTMVNVRGTQGDLQRAVEEKAWA